MKIPDVDRVPQLLLARVLGVTAKTIRNWGETGCPRRDDGRYCLKDVLEWRIELAEARAESGNGGDSVELEKWRKARRELAELDLSERRGLLVVKAEIAQTLARTMTVLRDKLLSLPNRIAPTMAALDTAVGCFLELDREVREMLQDTVDELTRIADQGDAADGELDGGTTDD